MCNMISCLVGKDARVYAEDGLHSHSEIARAFGISEDKCLKYEFTLRVRELFQDFNMDHAPFDAKASHDRAAQRFFDECASTPERLIAFVERGNFDENVLSSLLTRSAHIKYSDAKTSARKALNETLAPTFEEYRKTRTSSDEAFNKIKAEAQEENKAYNEAKESERKAYEAYVEVMKPADKAYMKTMVSAWIELFKNPKNRIEIWKN